MNTTNFPENVGDATIAYYFLCGIKHGLFEFDCAKAWAFDVIAARDGPPIEVIEVAAAKTRDANFCALLHMCGDADKQTAGRWLLATLRERVLESSTLDWKLLGCAMSIARDTELPDETYYDFDVIDDDLFLTQDKGFGKSASSCRVDFLKALAEHGVMLSSGIKIKPELG